MKNIAKKFLVICVAIIMTFSFVVTAYAQSNNWKRELDIKEFSNEDIVGVEASPRGQLISTITLQLSDEGYRTLGIYSEILCHSDMKKIKMSITLQRMVDGTWKRYNEKTFEWTSDDYDHLSMASASYNIGLLPAGDYRLSTAYVVYSLDGSLHESKTVTSPTKTVN